MGYTTDANYLLQAGEDIANLAELTGSRTALFESETVVEWHAWGTVNAQLGAAYHDLRQEMIEILLGSAVVMTAHSVALTATGEEYRAREEMVEEAMRAIGELAHRAENTIDVDRAESRMDVDR
ncbi:hypothetical protein [Actinophytocola sp. NPDC049390]|uniref:hypothetical protein n=1 Tax=Actinophytocola sp. NPDC049390 TaxID=3363894 RepID=UPI00379EAD19